MARGDVVPGRAASLHRHAAFRAGADGDEAGDPPALDGGLRWAAGGGRIIAGHLVSNQAPRAVAFLTTLH